MHSEKGWMRFPALVLQGRYVAPSTPADFLKRRKQVSTSPPQSRPAPSKAQPPPEVRPATEPKVASAAERRAQVEQVALTAAQVIGSGVQAVASAAGQVSPWVWVALIIR